MSKNPKRNPRHKAADGRGPMIQPYGDSDIGRQRQANEDSYLDLDKLQQNPTLYAQIAERAAQIGPLWIVADGMGGHVGGKQASSMVVEEILRHYYQDPASDPDQRLTNAIHRANATVYGYAQQHPELQGMGSTVVAAALQNSGLHLAWVGDSRVYLLRQGNLTALTEDHSWVQQALKLGTITKEEAAAHPNRSVILRSIGAKPQVEPGLNHYQTQPGDIYLLCSDGLTGVVGEEEIKQVLLSSPGPQTAVKRLIAQANERGGPDNITAAVIGLGAFKAAARPKPNRLPLVIAGILLALLGAIVAVMVMGGGKQVTQTIAQNPLFQPEPQTPDAAVGVQAEAPTIEPLATPLASSPLLTPTLTTTITSTSTPTPTLTSTATVTPTAATPTSTITPFLAITPTLLLPPADGDTLFTGSLSKFQWRWADDLPPDLGFEVLIWLAQDAAEQADHPGAFDAVEYRRELTSPEKGMYEISFDVDGAASVKRHGPSEGYLWTVVLVRVQPGYERLGPEAEPRPIHIAKPGPPGKSDEKPGSGGGGINF